MTTTGTTTAPRTQRGHQHYVIARLRPTLPSTVHMPGYCPRCSAAPPQWKILGPRAFCVMCGADVDTQP